MTSTAAKAVYTVTATALQPARPKKSGANVVPRRSELKRVKFGTTDMMVTEVCAGTMTWGSFNDKEEMAVAQLDKMFIELGVNFLDTAELYPVGWNYGALTERWIGNWLGREGHQKWGRSGPYSAHPYRCRRITQNMPEESLQPPVHFGVYGVSSQDPPTRSPFGSSVWAHATRSGLIPKNNIFSLERMPTSIDAC
jgi:hypothetical protein